jgi:hypothetical protein
MNVAEQTLSLKMIAKDKIVDLDLRLSVVVSYISVRTISDAGSSDGKRHSICSPFARLYPPSRFCGFPSVSLEQARKEMLERGYCSSREYGCLRFDDADTQRVAEVQPFRNRRKCRGINLTNAREPGKVYRNLRPAQRDAGAQQEFPQVPCGARELNRVCRMNHVTGDGCWTASRMGQGG